MTAKRSRRKLLLLTIPLIGAAIFAAAAFLSTASRPSGANRYNVVTSTKQGAATSPTLETPSFQRIQSIEHPTISNPVAKSAKVLKLLHVVTTMTEFESGTRGTSKGVNRFTKKVLPTIAATVQSLLQVLVGATVYAVDVQLILGYNMSQNSLDQLKSALGPKVGLHIWSEAMPRDEEGRRIPLMFARQHRLVVKDRLYDYDFFSCWEDDMYINRRSFDNFIALSAQLEQLAKRAPLETTSFGSDTQHPISRQQFEHMVPGFIRVEWYDHQNEIRCCDLKAQRLMAWEASAKSFRMRSLEGVGTVGFLPLGGAKIDTCVGATAVDEGAGVSSPRTFAQQAGWMASREQVIKFQTFCQRGFLPPFKFNPPSREPKQTVEFWSGGWQMFRECGLQRVVSFDYDSFQASLLYHTSNNKQTTITKSRHTDMALARTQLIASFAKMNS